MQSNDFEIAVKHFKTYDKFIYKLIQNKSSVNINPTNNYFPALLKSIIGQQLSVNSAKSIIERFFKRFSKKPSYKSIIEADVSTLRELGLSRAKALYVKDLAEKLSSREISFRNINSLSNEEVLELLTKVKGIGPWTVDMFLMFTLGRLNILPVGDLGIKKAIMLNYGFKNLPTEKEVGETSIKNNWAPYNTIVSLYLW